MTLGVGCTPKYFGYIPEADFLGVKILIFEILGVILGVCVCVGGGGG